MSDPDPTTDPADGTGQGTGPRLSPDTDPAGSTADPAGGVVETVLDEQFDPSAATNGGAGAESDLRRLSEVPMELSVEIGRTHITVGETLQLRAGSVITLDRLAGEPVDLLVNGTPIARGEVVVVDEQFGLRVTQIVEGEGAGHTAGAANGAGHTAAASAGDDQTPEV